MSARISSAERAISRLQMSLACASAATVPRPWAAACAASRAAPAPWARCASRSRVPSTRASTPRTVSPVSPAAAAATEASLRTSSATTAKPRPCGPARAASIAAFKASMLVCVAIALVCVTNFWISPAAWASAAASFEPRSTSSASLASCAVL